MLKPYQYLSFAVLFVITIPMPLLAQEAALTPEQLKVTHSVSKSVLKARVSEKQRIQSETAVLRQHLNELKNELNALNNLESTLEPSVENIAVAPVSEVVDTNPDGNIHSNEAQNKTARTVNRPAQKETSEKETRRSASLSKSRSTLTQTKTEISRLINHSDERDKERYQRLWARLNTLESDLNDYEGERDDKARQSKIRNITSKIDSNTKEDTSERKNSPDDLDTTPTFTTITKHK